MALPTKLSVKPLTPARWADFEAVFQARGCSVARNCWCMYYRNSGREDRPTPGQTLARTRHQAFKALVDAGEFTGLLAYRGRQPVGWLSFGPREVFRKLARSQVMKPVDSRPVWSVICFVVPAQFRGQGVARVLLEGAIAYAAKQGVALLEAYPVDRDARSSDDAMWFGAKSMFDAAGFEEVARRRPHRPVVRIHPA
jgi:ribosomal protein S18 acetylase RimI-like enzyme